MGRGIEKALTYSGNSFAVVIDKPLCRAMGIGHGSLVSLIVDERGRLIIERTGRKQGEPVVIDQKRVPESLLLKSAPAEFGRALRKAGVNFEVLPRLVRPYHGEARFFAITLERADLTNLSELSIANLNRLHVCLDQRNAGHDMETAIAEALRRYPFDSSDAMSAGTGASAVTGERLAG